MVNKALGLDLDVAMLDLEDGVVPALKEEARPIVAKALQSRAGQGGPIRYVRVNGFTTGDLQSDLEAVVVPGLAGIVLPKVEEVEEVRAVADRLQVLEQKRGLESGSIKMLLAIETARSIITAPALAVASPRVSGLAFGGEDFSRDIGLATVRTGRARDFIYARSAIVIAATAARIVSVDAVWPELKDEAGLIEDSRLARHLGFTGKSLINPSQINVINDIFSPTEREVEFAQALIVEFEQAVKEGKGSISFAGALVDRPIYERACATVQQARKSM